MIPYFDQPTLTLGPLTLHAFGTLVAAAVLLGMEVGRRRLARLPLGARVSDDLAWYIVVGGLLGAHWFSLIFYFPEKLAADPLSLLRFWEDLSSFGSMLGGLAGLALFIARRGRHLSRAGRWALLDVVVYSFALALTAGRIACTVAHDHPGLITDFPLAFSLESEEARAYITAVYAGAGRLAELPEPAVLATLGFHDLGWYEFLYLLLVVTPLMLLAGRRPQAPGTLLLVFIVLYMPARFLLDFLRVSDLRYAGLTPAQWAAVLFLVAVPVLRRFLRGVSRDEIATTDADAGRRVRSKSRGKG